MIGWIERPDALLERLAIPDRRPTAEELAGVIQGLSIRELFVISRRYAARPWTLAEIGSDIGISARAVQSTQDRAISRIRRALDPR